MFENFINTANVLSTELGIAGALQVEMGRRGRDGARFLTAAVVTVAAKRTR